MSDLNTGEEAFPAAAFGDGVHINRKGMTIRDYFAASASEEDIAAHNLKGFDEKEIVDVGHGVMRVQTRPARWTREQAKFRYADAMIQARDAK